MSIELKKRLVSLLVKTDSFTTANMFAQELDISSRTVYAYLDEVEDMIDQSGCTLEKVPGKGIALTGSQLCKDKLIHTIETDYAIDLDPISRQLLILKILLRNETLTYQSLADKYFVSRSTIVKDFKVIKNAFLTESTEIVSTNEGSKLKANERAIQKIWGNVLSFHYDYVKGHPPLNLYDYSDFVQKELALTSDAIDPLLTEVERIGSVYELADYYRVHLFETLVILYYRVSMGKHRDENQGYIFEKVTELETYYIAHDIAENMMDHSGYEFTMEDRLYINECLIASGIKNKVDAPHRLYYERMADELVARISSILNEDFSADDQLKNGLVNHLVPMCFRLKNNIKLQNPYISQIKKQYSMMFHLTWYVVVDIEQELGTKIPEDEIAFLMIHFQSALERRRDIKKILIVTKTGLLTGEILERRIKNVLPSIHIYEVLSEEKVAEVDLAKVDLIISTIAIDISEPTVLEVHSIPSDSELKELARKVTEIFSNQSLLSHEQPLSSESEHPLISSFKNRLSIESGSVSSLEEAITKLLVPLEENDLVEKQYKQSVFEREATSSTSFEAGVAIPHGNPNYVKDTRINIFLNDKKISWGEEKVDVIILLSVAKDDINSISFFIERLYEVIHSRDEIERVFFNQSAPAIYHHFARYN